MMGQTNNNSHSGLSLVGEGKDEGYVALCVALLYPDEVTADEAFALLDGGMPRKISKKKLDPALAAEFVRLKQTMTYKEIGKLYNLAPDTICRYVKEAESLAS